MARESKKSVGIRWRLWLGIAVACAACASTAVAALKIHRYAVTDPRFSLSSQRKDAIAIEGLTYASRARVLRVFAPDFGRSVFSIPLAERRRRLLAIDWVEDASISRAWPDRLIVRIRERKPVAFVFFRSGPMLIDGQGVLLEPPPRAQFAFPVLSGIGVEDSDASRAERVRAFLALQQELGDSSRDVSEVNAADLENIRVIARLDNRALELWMGDGDFARRYRNFVNHYADIEKQSPDVKTFDLRLDDRITAKE